MMCRPRLHSKLYITACYTTFDYDIDNQTFICLLLSSKSTICLLLAGTES